MNRVEQFFDLLESDAGRRRLEKQKRLAEEKGRLLQEIAKLDAQKKHIRDRLDAIYLELKKE